MTKDRVAALLVTLAPLVFFYPATAGDLFISPDDGVIQNVPFRVAAARIALSGSLPLWNPYIFSGTPLHAEAQAGLLFPLNWFFLAFAPEAATNLMMLASYALAALGAYVCARRSGSSVAGAVVTSLAWQLSGFALNQIGHTNVMQTAAVLPWVVWAVDGYGRTGRAGRGALLAALVAIQCFAGHQQTFAYTLLLVAAYAVWMWRSSSEKLERASYLKSLVYVAAGVLLAAVQILPTFELLRNSPRAEATYDFFTSFSMPPRFALNFLAPYLSGGGAWGIYRAPYVGPSFFGEYVGYVGLMTIMLASVAVWARRDAWTKFWAAVAVVCLVLAFGRFVPFGLYKVIYYVPVLNLFRVPARHLMEVEFALALLAGRGLTVIAAARGDARLTRKVLVVGSGVLLLACVAVTAGRPDDFKLARAVQAVTLLRAPELFMPILIAGASAWALWFFARGKGWRRGAVALPLAVLAVDLFLWGQAGGWRVSSPGPESPLWREPATVQYVRERGAGGPYRILTAEHPFDPDVPASTDAPRGVLRLALQPDTYMMHGVENAAGYGGFWLARYSRLAGDMKVWGELPDPERTLRGEGRELDLLNVRYLLSMPRPTAGTAQPSSTAAATPAPPASADGLSFPPAAQVYGGQAFAAEDLGARSLEAGERLTFEVPRVDVDGVAIVTNLSWSVAVPDGAVVGRVRLRAEGGRTFELELRAGEHTAEWAYDRPDIRPSVLHARAPVASSFPVEDAQGRYEGHTYVASFKLPERAAIVGGEVAVARVGAAPELSLSVRRVSLVDSAGGKTFPLRREWARKELAPAKPQPQTRVTTGGAAAATKMAPAPQPAATPAPSQAAARWRRLGEVEGVAVFENARALPRAWLASGEVVAGDEEMLKVIRTGRLAGGAEWNPQHTALVEAPTGAAFGQSPSPGRAEVLAHEANYVGVKTSSAAPSLLVLSENHYPGWRAYVDGESVDVLRVDYNLRGVALAAGEHEVEFFYRPASVIFGFVISLLAALALALPAGLRYLKGRGR
ncbi:MAG TPA: YfhO family protein [Pyrinomonadaceae bacterium]|nr:YfhO family protein [Pyrinomonadaceae bacterium]